MDLPSSTPSKMSTRPLQAAETVSTKRPRQKPIMDSLKPVCVSIRKKLEQTMEGKPTQKFRHLQHLTFGVSDSEWKTLKHYFACYEMLGVGVQKDLWLHKHAQRLKFTLLAAPPEQRDTMMAEELHTYVDLQHASKENTEKCKWAVEQLDQAGKTTLGHTPIFRALRWNQARPDWHLSDWAVSRCVEAGGCCGRECGCCAKIGRKYLYEAWKGHCTPACGCCLENLGVVQPVNVLEYLEQPSFEVRPRRGDTLSRMMMHAYVWGLEGKKATTAKGKKQTISAANT
ncbi:hypothetical protein BDW59DRAFT_155426 [Aspergillus cavernicola]|uniref:Uncharacterized protein n=1 Tax=Aspergillus cavernicola TaxID=176166 RepID=A0ABR4H9J3_9EURO